MVGISLRCAHTVIAVSCLSSLVSAFRASGGAFGNAKSLSATCMVVKNSAAMEYNKLGSSDLLVSRCCLGTMTWGQVSDALAVVLEQWPGARYLTHSSLHSKIRSRRAWRS